VRKLKSKIYEWLLKKSIEKSRLEGKDKIIFLVKELREELNLQGYDVSTEQFPASFHVYQYKGKMEVQNIQRGWSVKG
jgi:hypothetical protein